LGVVGNKVQKRKNSSPESLWRLIRDKKVRHGDITKTERIIRALSSRAGFRRKKGRKERLVEVGTKKREKWQGKEKSEKNFRRCPRIGEAEGKKV